MGRQKLMRLITIVIVTGMVMAGCTKENNGQNNTTTPTEPVTTEAPTVPPTCTPFVETAEYKKAKISGTKEDYEQYFQVKEADYRQKVDKTGKMEEVTYNSSFYGGAERKVSVYTPADYSTDREYPVIYLIHGLGCDSSQWISMGAQKFFDYMIAAGMVEPFVAVFPSIIPKDGLTKNTFSDENIAAFANFEKELTKDLEPFLKNKYSISTKREDTAVCGLSMGGMQALRLGFSRLDKFAYIGSFSAAPTLETKLLTTKNSEYVPKLVLLCSGDSDSTVKDNPLNYHIELAKNGVDHIWYQYPGGNHSPEVWNSGLINFLKLCFK